MSEVSEVRTLNLSSSSHDYLVSIGSGLLESYLIAERLFVIADIRFEKLLKSLGVSHAIYISAFEEHKNLVTVEHVMLSLKRMGMTRGDLLTVIGGGIIQDIATISASLYMRGVKWVYFPTTLLGMTDSCIGGKSSINAGEAKNLIGNIFPPTEVVIDVNFISTLRPVEINAGLAEAGKIAFCHGSNSFSEFLELFNSSNELVWEELLFLVLRLKKWFIEIDEFDQKERQLLNFGHTFGHALEAATDFRIPHGIAVAMGVLAAGLLVEGNDQADSVTTELDVFMTGLVIPLEGKGLMLDGVDWEKYAQAFEADKKHGQDMYRVIIPVNNSGVKIYEMPKIQDSVQRIVRAQKTAIERVMT
jgi:3-dehydroquinate synthase